MQWKYGLHDLSFTFKNFCECNLLFDPNLSPDPAARESGKCSFQSFSLYSKGRHPRRSGNRCGVSIEYTVSNTENKWVWHNMELVFMQLKVQIRLTSLQSLTLNHYTTLPAHQDVPYFQMQLFWKLVDFNRKNLPDNKWLENENKQTKTHRHYLSFFKKWLAFYSN